MKLSRIISQFSRRWISGAQAAEASARGSARPRDVCSLADRKAGELMPMRDLFAREQAPSHVDPHRFAALRARAFGAGRGGARARDWSAGLFFAGSAFAGAYALETAETPGLSGDRSPQPYRKLGEGGSGLVVSIDRPDGSTVAVKIISDDTGDNERNALERMAGSPYVVQLHAFSENLDGALLKNAKSVLALDEGKGGDLSWHLYRTGALSEDAARRYFRQLAEGLEAMHSVGIIHCDIKPQNIVLTEDKQRVLYIDLGSAWVDPVQGPIGSTKLDEPGRGTVGYMAPEGPTSAVADVYSLAKVLRAMLRGSFEIQPRASEACESLLRRMEDPDPARRPTAREILADPWLQG